MHKPRFDFGDGIRPQKSFENWEKIISDRGSVYSVSIGRVKNRDEVSAFITKTKKLKNHHKATHHSWATRIANEGAIYETKRDDGETGAGAVILRILQKKNLIDAAVCVTRWYGGVKLQADRFKHVQDATIFALDQAVRENQKK